MRRLAGICAATAVAATLVAGAQAATPPTLRLVTERPLIVRGIAFRPNERVSLTALTLLGPEKIVVRASRTGTFRAPFGLVAQPCGKALAVRALGGAGSRAVLRMLGTPCIPPPID
jgi:hypothetical protein